MYIKKIIMYASFRLSVRIIYFSKYNLFWYNSVFYIHIFDYGWSLQIIILLTKKKQLSTKAVNIFANCN